MKKLLTLLFVLLLVVAGSIMVNHQAHVWALIAFLGANAVAIVVNRGANLFR